MRFCFFGRTKPHKAAQRPAQNRTKPVALLAWRLNALPNWECRVKNKARRGAHAATPALSQNWYQSVGSKKEGGPKPPMNQCW